MSAKLLTQDSIIKSIKKAEARWVDAQMKKAVPGWVYRGMHASGEQKERAVGRLREHNYTVKRDREYTVIVKGFKELARTRLILDLSDPADLIAIAKVAKIQTHGNN